MNPNTKPTTLASLILRALGVSPSFSPASAGRPSKGRRAGAYGRGLQNQIARRNRDRMERERKAGKRTQHRDEHGAFTLTGAKTFYDSTLVADSRRHEFSVEHHDGVVSRRKWLAGVSAQRGY